MAQSSSRSLTAEDVLLELMNSDVEEIDLEIEEPMCEFSDDDLEPEDAVDRYLSLSIIHIIKCSQNIALCPVLQLSLLLHQYHPRLHLFCWILGKDKRFMKIMFMYFAYQ